MGVDYAGLSIARYVHHRLMTIEQWLILPLLVSALASIVVSLLIEKARIPELEIGSPHEERVPFNSGGTPIGVAASYRLRVSNKQTSRFLRWFVHRHVARDCRATLTFVARDGVPIPRLEMPGRWAGSVQPVPIEGVVGASKERVVLYDHARFAAASRIDIPPDISEVLDVAVHFEGDADAFGWTNSSYRYGAREPQYRLTPGEYAIEVSVFAEGVTARKTITMRIGRSPAPQLPGAPALTPLHIEAPVSESIGRAGT